MMAPLSPTSGSRIALYLSDDGHDLALRISEETASIKGLDVAEIFRIYSEIVFVSAVPIAVRLIAPHIGEKGTDPSVVSIDETGKFVVALLSGHRGGNALAASIAAVLGATPVITTLSDLTGTVALDSLVGFTAVGAVASVQNQINHGQMPQVDNTIDWPLPSALKVGDGPSVLKVSDAAFNLDNLRLHDVVQLIPESLVAGIGCSSSCTAKEVEELLARALSSADLSPAAIGAIATIDRRRDHPAIAGLSKEVYSYTAPELDSVSVPNPSGTVKSSVGTASVAEAAALLGAGHGSELVVTKFKSKEATVAIARRRKTKAKLYVVGTGPGGRGTRTHDCEKAVRSSDTIVGFGPYIDLIEDLLTTSQAVHRYPIGAEAERVRHALASTSDGHTTALICSGDPGVYAMATLAFEEAEIIGFDPALIVVVPGITVALAASAFAGAPLGHDHVYISLSDLMTPWSTIEGRIVAAAEADLVVTFYNPRSKRRTAQLDRAIAILSLFRSPETPVVLARRVGRSSESITTTTLAEFDASSVDMETLIIVGNTSTKRLGSRVYTPRGYHSDT